MSPVRWDNIRRLVVFNRMVPLNRPLPNRFQQPSVGRKFECCRCLRFRVARLGGLLYYRANEHDNSSHTQTTAPGGVHQGEDCDVAEKTGQTGGKRNIGAGQARPEKKMEDERGWPGQDCRRGQGSMGKDQSEEEVTAADSGEGPFGGASFFVYLVPLIFFCRAALSGNRAAPNFHVCSA